MGEKRIAVRLLVGKPEGKKPLGRPKHRWVYNIEMGLRAIGISRAFVTVVMNLWVP
jgi:hypothetical protein